MSISSLISKGALLWPSGRQLGIKLSWEYSIAYTNVVVSQSLSFPDCILMAYTLFLPFLAVFGILLNKKFPLAILLCHLLFGYFWSHLSMNNFLKYFGKISKTILVIFTKYSSSRDIGMLITKSRKHTQYNQWNNSTSFSEIYVLVPPWWFISMFIVRMLLFPMESNFVSTCCNSRKGDGYTDRVVDFRSDRRVNWSKRSNVLETRWRERMIKIEWK